MIAILILFGLVCSGADAALGPKEAAKGKRLT
jgi:hypothetical protein